MHHPMARKSLGQNFLVDAHALRTIAELCEAREGETIVEIGPGTGNLTERLLQYTKAGRVVAIEKDDRMIPELHTRFGDSDRLVVVPGDALCVEWADIAGPGRGNIAVGNLPYYAATEIHFGLLARGDRFRRLVLMFQREVADRIAATVESGGAYGIPSVLTALWGRAHVALRLPPGAFRPAPKVHSAVVVIDISPEPLLDVEGDPEGFKRMVRASLALRRKTLANALIQAGFAGRDVIAAAIEAAGLAAGVRAEACSPAQLAALWRELRRARGTTIREEEPR